MLCLVRHINATRFSEKKNQIKNCCAEIIVKIRKLRKARSPSAMILKRHFDRYDSVRFDLNISMAAPLLD